MAKTAFDVTINVTAHKEGVLIHKTLRSMWAGIERAQEEGISLEMNISLDKPDQETKRIVSEFCEHHPKANIHIYEIDLGDLGLSRNFLVGKSRGKYIAFFDGDDFFTENFISEAYKLAEQQTKPAIYSAYFCASFENMHYISRILSSEEVPLRNLFEYNYFLSQNLVHRKIYEEIKYETNNEFYGYEDWHFNCEVIARGYKFITVPDTIFFYRRKRQGSLLQGQLQNKAVLRPSKLFHPDTFIKLTANDNLSKLVTEKVTLVERIKRNLRKHTLTFHYFKTMYYLHIGTLRAWKVRLAEILPQKVIIDDEYADISKKIEEYKLSPPARLVEIGLTTEAVIQWGKLNKYEPMIRPSWDNLESITIYEYPTSSEMSDVYMNICKKYGTEGYTDLVLIPQMKKGGAELATIHLAKSLAESGKKVLVIATLKTDSPWAHRLQSIPNVKMVYAHEIFMPIDDDERRLLIVLKMIQNWGFERVNAVNVEFGYKLFINYGKLISNESRRTYIHAYAYDITEDGYLFNYIQNGLVDIYGTGTKYVTDSSVFKDQLVQVNGFRDSDIIPLYLPVDTKIRKKKSYKKTKKILYASRICSQKIPEVAIGVASVLEKEGIELHFYGSIDREYAINDRFIKLIAPHKNVFYHGTYDGFPSLNIDEYDMLLLTTRTEGMANIILETCFANLYTVSASVGGLPECIVNGKNGYLVDNNDKFNPEAYAEAIIDSYNRNLFSDVNNIDLVNEVVRKRHSISNFKDTIKRSMLR